MSYFRGSFTFQVEPLKGDQPVYSTVGAFLDRKGQPDFLRERRVKIERRYNGLGYVKLTVDGGSELGRKTALDIVRASKFVIPTNCLQPTHTRQIDQSHLFGKVFHLAGLIQKGKDVTFFGTLEAGVNLQRLLGNKGNGSLAGQMKRMRSLYSNMQLCLFGTIVDQSEATLNVTFRYEKHSLTVDVYTIDFTRFSNWQEMGPVAGTYRARLGIVRLGKGLIDRQLVGMTDGAHLVHAGRIEQGLDVLGIERSEYQLFAEGAGASVRLDIEKAIGKGHMQSVGHLGDLDFLFLDKKTNFGRTDKEVHLSFNSLGISDGLRTDNQAVTNFNLAAFNVLADYGTKAISEYSAILNDPQRGMKFAALCGVNLFSLEEGTSDAMDADSRYVLNQMHHVLHNNGLGIYDNGTRIDITMFPGLMKSISRQICDRFVNLSKMRIPVPQEVGACGYAFFDTSIVSKEDLGLNFDQSVLPAWSAALMQKRMFAFGTAATLIHGDNFSPVPAVLYRRPSGWGGELVPNFELVYEAFYASMTRSPFLNLSVRDVEVAPWMELVIPATILRDLIDLYGTRIPTVALVLAIMGGADQDDLICTLRGEIAGKLSASHAAMICEYPNPELPALDARKERPVSRHTVKAHSNVSSASYDQSALLDMVRKGMEANMIGKLANSARVYNAMWHDGTRFDSLAPAAYRITEQVIDQEAKGDGSLPLKLIEKAINEPYHEIFAKDLAVPEFIANGNMPGALASLFTKAGRTIRTYESAIDSQLKVVAKDLDDLRQAISDGFGLKYRLPAAGKQESGMPFEVILSELFTYPVSDAALAVADSIRTEFIDAGKAWEAAFRKDCKDRQIELSELAMSTARKQWNVEKDAELSELVATVTNPWQVAIALYRLILTKHSPVKGKDNLEYAIADGQLFLPNMGAQFVDALKHVYVLHTEPVSPAPVPTETLVPATEEVASSASTVQMTFTVVNGMKGKSDTERNAWQSVATSNALVTTHFYGADNDEDMLAYWERCPAKYGVIEDAVELALEDDSTYGWLPLDQVAAFLAIPGSKRSLEGLLMPFLRNGIRQNNIVRLAIEMEVAQ